MKICYVCEEFPLETPKGGIATYQYIISHGMKRYNHEVHVICKTQYSTRDEIVDGIILHYLNFKIEENSVEDVITYRKKVYKKMKELEDTVDIFEVADWGGEAIYYLSERKKPVIIKLHTPFSIWKKYNQVKVDDVWKLREIYENASLNLADALYSCSNSLAQKIQTEYKVDNKIEVIHNPIILNKDITTEKNKDKTLVFIGSLEERKGVINLSEILNSIFEMYNDYKFIFIGKDTNRNRYNISTKLIILNNIKDKFKENVIFTGQLNHAEIKQYIRRASLAIFPSLYENFPYVMIETINEGCPVLGSLNGGMPEIITHKISGLLCNPYNAHDILQNIIFALENETLLQLYSQQAKKDLVRFDINNIVSQTISLYERVVRNEKK